MQSKDHIWGIVLAGGEGKRLQEFIRDRYGMERPKQYSAIIGKRSMLRHTLDRIEKIIPPKQLQIVIDKKHRDYAWGEISEKERRAVLIAPVNRESAASIFLALSHISYRDPEAIVSVFPSDHFIGEEGRFLRYVENALSFAARHPDFIALQGVKPTFANMQYGWIEPSRKFLNHYGDRYYRVVRSSEKPDLKEAQQLFDNGSLWNSFVFTGKSKTLLRMYKKDFQEIYDAFKKMKTVYGTGEEYRVMEEIFSSIPSRNFSECILEKNTASLYVLCMEGILWSDWGNKEQVLHDLDYLGMVH
jgi:mannose-1-phosphate guanylyltransferase